MDASELLFSHQYAQYEAACNEAIEAVPSDEGWIGERATVRLCLGRFCEAKTDFARANALCIQESRGESSFYSAKLATTHWLLGEHSQAMAVMQEVIEGYESGRIQFGDLSGGGTNGLLLWYMALVENDTAMRECALSFLCGLGQDRDLTRYWPGPLVLLARDDMTYDDVLKSLRKSHGTRFVERAARKDLGVRRDFCKALFYLATKHLESGNQEEHLRQMAKCAALENPILEPEWYLARAISDSGKPAN